MVVDREISVREMLPFEDASNRSFAALLATGLLLLAVVAVLGRSPATMALVAAYLLSVPGYVAYRVLIWQGADDGSSDGSSGNSRPQGDNSVADGAADSGADNTADSAAEGPIHETGSTPDRANAKDESGQNGG